jgi:hypothetical protein
MYTVIFEYMSTKLCYKLLCNNTECVLTFIQTSDKGFS